MAVKKIGGELSALAYAFWRIFVELLDCKFIPYICDREQRGEVYKTQYM